MTKITGYIACDKHGVPGKSFGHFSVIMEFDGAVNFAKTMQGTLHTPAYQEFYTHIASVEVMVGKPKKVKT